MQKLSLKKGVWWTIPHLLLFNAAHLHALPLDTTLECTPLPSSPSTALQVTVTLPNWNGSTAPTGASATLWGVEVRLTRPTAVGSPVDRAPRLGDSLYTGTTAPYNVTSEAFANKTAGAFACQARCDADERCQAWTYCTGDPGSLQGPEECSLLSVVGCPFQMSTFYSGAKAPNATCTVAPTAEQGIESRTIVTQGPFTSEPGTVGWSINVTVSQLQPATTYDIAARASDDPDYFSLLGYGALSTQTPCATLAAAASGLSEHSLLNPTNGSNASPATRFLKLYRMTEGQCAALSSPVQPDFLDNKDSADLDGTVASYSDVTVRSAPQYAVSEYCVEMLDVPYGHYLSCTPGAKWGNVSAGCGIGPGFATASEPRGECSYPCWCSVVPDMNIGGDVRLHSLCNMATSCCLCDDPGGDVNGTYSGRYFGRMNFSASHVGVVQGGWYSAPQRGRCLRVGCAVF
eukprot:INCI16278.2.p1 GENE.INCI16278.2~~INCI16278.2.p1  ORF type:complete len:460 (+),score=49.02 INCI16278.2:159-1538(+)